MKEKKYKLLVFNEDWADEHDVPALEVMSEKQYNKWLENKEPEIYAYLGNSGDGFDEQFEGMSTKDLVKTGNVKVYNVDENFKKIFDKAELSSLSLCSIFDN